MTVVSFEKRVMMRPGGFASKKETGLRMSACVMRRWKFTVIW